MSHAWKTCEDGPRAWSADSLTDAKGLLLSITASHFICALVITNKCLQGYLKALTSGLQKEAQDVVEAVAEIDNVVIALKEVRDNIDDNHKEWFGEAKKMCQAVAVLPSLPRQCGCQRHRDNVPAEDPITYFRRCITIPLVDHLLVALETRFSPHHRVTLQGLCLVPSASVTLPDDEIKSNMAKLVAQYEDDLTSSAQLEDQVAEAAATA